MPVTTTGPNGVIVVRRHYTVVVGPSSSRSVTVASDDNTVTVAASGPQGATGQQGPVGPPGGTTTTIARDTIQAFHVVALDSAGLAYHADNEEDFDADRALGVSLYAALPGELVAVRGEGVLDTGATTWSPGPLYLGTGGALVSAAGSGAFAMQIAVAVSANELIVRPHPPVKLA